MSDLNTVIKSDTKVLFNKVAPDSKSELARAGTLAERGAKSKNKNPERGAKTVPQGRQFPNGRCGTSWQFRLARARSCTTGAMKTGTGRT